MRSKCDENSTTRINKEKQEDVYSSSQQFFNRKIPTTNCSNDRNQQCVSSPKITICVRESALSWSNTPQPSRYESFRSGTSMVYTLTFRATFKYCWIGFFQVYKETPLGRLDTIQYIKFIIHWMSIQPLFLTNLFIVSLNGLLLTILRTW